VNSHAGKEVRSSSWRHGADGVLEPLRGEDRADDLGGEEGSGVAVPDLRVVGAGRVSPPVEMDSSSGCAKTVMSCLGFTAAPAPAASRAGLLHPAAGRPRLP